VPIEKEEEGEEEEEEEGEAYMLTYVIVCILSTGIGFMQKHCRL
jgi:hypothetical protein